MNRQEMEKIVLVSLATILKCEVDLNSSRANTHLWDSLKHIEVIFVIEDELGVQFSEEEMADLDSVGKIIDAALSQHAA